MIEMSMSTTDSSTIARPATTDDTTPRRSASYLGCRECGEGAIVWDADAGQSRCRCCGALD